MKLLGYIERQEKYRQFRFLNYYFHSQGRIISPQSLATIQKLTLELEKLPSIQSVLSILDASIFFQPKVPLADLMDNLTLESKDVDFEAAKEKYQ